MKFGGFCRLFFLEDLGYATVLLALLQKFVGEFLFDKLGGKSGGNFAGFLSDPRNKGSIISGKFSEHFS